jgi:hypothetical protein
MKIKQISLLDEVLVLVQTSVPEYVIVIRSVLVELVLILVPPFRSEASALVKQEVEAEELQNRIC